MIKRLVSSLLYHGGCDLLYASWYRQRYGPQLCVLSGHRIIDQSHAESLEDVRDLRRGCLSVAAFGRAIAYLQRHYQFLALETARDAGEDLLPRAVVLTFDDAHKDVAIHAHPILSAAEIPFTIFQTTSYLGTNPRMLDRDDLVRMREDPLITWGSHGVTHRPLTELSDTDLENELRDSKARLEDILGKPVNHLCYPDGKYNAHVIDRAKAAGYRSACTTGRRLNCLPITPFAITRIPFDNEPLPRFAFRVAGRT